MAIWEMNVNQMKYENNVTVSKDKGTPCDFALIMPHQENVTMQWAFYWKQMNFGTHKYFFNRGYPWDVARTDMTRSAIEANPKYLFYLDSDTYHEDPNAVQILRQIADEKDLDIVSGLYWAKKRDLITPCAWIKQDVPDKPLHPQFLCIDKIQEHIKKANIIEVSVAGLGFCLVKPRVFHEWKRKLGDKPFFRWGIGLSDDELTKLGIYGTSEDFNFFLACKEKLGFSPYVATGIVCGHIGEASREGIDGKTDFLKV